MRALVLVGGEGTRLQPLTLTLPKPAIPLVDRPFIRYTLEWLAQHEVEEVVMACGFGADPLREVLGDGGGDAPRLVYLEEPEPLGTAGPVRLAADRELLGERFLVLNGDVLADLDLSALITTHEELGAGATLALYPVEDPSSYGLVRRAGGPPGRGGAPATAEGEVLEFIEKPGPGPLRTNEINAGAYVLDRTVVDLIPPGRMVSIEREVFPRLVGRGLYGQRLEGYWMDIGTPERYLQASWDILEGRVRTAVDPGVNGPRVLVQDRASIDGAAIINPPAVLQEETTIGAGATIGSRAVIGARSEVGERAAVRGSVLLSDCRIGRRASVDEAILAAGVEVGEGARVGAGAVVGEGARIGPAVAIADGARLGPGEVAR
jgi:mannose-1-phosphate guanylyltransferase